MRLVTSVTAFAAVMAFGVGAASSCEWMKQQVTAMAPPAEVTQPVAATTVDPLLLAAMTRTNGTEAPDKADVEIE